MARSDDKFVLVRKTTGNDKKLAPQAKVIYDILHQHGVKKEMLRIDLIAALKKAQQEGTLTTKQLPTRVLAFYQPRLIQAGLIQMEQAPNLKSTKTKKAA